jgi:DNA-binding response OmpR family regulator
MPARVLIAEPDAWARDSLARLLSEAGCQVGQASNGMAALRLAEQQSPQVAIIGAPLSEVSSPEVVDTLTRRGVAVFQSITAALAHLLTAA